MGKFMKTDYTVELLDNETEYEFLIEHAEKSQSPNTGTDYIEVQLRVREDVEQKHQGFRLNDRNYRNKEGKYNMRKLNGLAKAAGIPENTEFEDEDEFCEEITGQPVRAFVMKVDDDYVGREVNRIGFYKPPEHEYKKPGGSEKTEKKEDDTDDIDIADDDLPF